VNAGDVGKALKKEEKIKGKKKKFPFTKRDHRLSPFFILLQINFNNWGWRFSTQVNKMMSHTLDEFYFTTVEKKILENGATRYKLNLYDTDPATQQMYCSEFHE